MALLNHFLTAGNGFYIHTSLGTFWKWFPEVDADKVLMWGWSHGGCVTQRAVQQGAHVKAAVTFSAVADDALFYNWCVSMNPLLLAAHQLPLCSEAGWRGMHGPDGGNSPDADAPAYQWRSPPWFESLDVGLSQLSDAAINWQTASHPIGMQSRPDVPFLMLQGGAGGFEGHAGDGEIPDWTACELSAAFGSSCTNWFVDSTGSGRTTPLDCATHGFGNLNWNPYLGGNTKPEAGALWNPTQVNWGTNSAGGTHWNLVWVTGDNHTDILTDNSVAWPTFYAFVHSLAWGVDVAASAPKSEGTTLTQEMVAGP
jgi:hypothetical protein